jgi:hypothetical protein
MSPLTEVIDVPADTAVIDPLDQIIEQTRPITGQFVDALHLAAYLESTGITDRIARVDYGFVDVFGLAEEMYRRLAPLPEPPLKPKTGGWRLAARNVSHGLLYLLPTAGFPAAVAVLGHHALAVALLLAGGLGWVWSGAATWLAYHRLGRDQAASAARVLVTAALAGLPAGALLGLAIVAFSGAGFGIVAMVVAVMAYQMASTLLIFYRKELWLALAMAPAVGAGAAYVVDGDRWRWWSIGISFAAIATAFAAGLQQTVAPSRGRYRRRRAQEALRSDLKAIGPVLVYTALTAGFLLHAEARYMFGRLDMVLAVMPLLAGMGIVEWRAHRFQEHAKVLLTRVRRPGRFIARIWLWLAAEALVCMAAVGALAGVMLLALYATDQLSAAGVVMTVAFVTLAGTYFISFILSGQAGYGRLILAVAAATAMHVGTALVAPRELSPLADTTVFLGSAVLLQVLVIAALAGVVGRVWQYR